MNAYLLVSIIALTAGLRTFVPLFAVRWPYMNWTTWLAGIFALFELVADKLPGTVGRTQPGPLVLRCLVGAFCAWAVGTPLGVPMPVAVAIGIVGAIAGAFLGFTWRVRWAPAIKFPAIAAALIEDAVAAAAAFWVVLGAH
jgi:uncharacterized membrane protein